MTDPLFNPGRLPRRQSPWLTICLLLGCTASAWGADPAAEHFEKHVRPILVRHCYECHSAAATEPKGKLRLDTREGVLKGGESGPAVVPGKPEESLLVSAIRHESFKMPPAGKLPDSVIADLVTWIAQGAFDPRESPQSLSEAQQQIWADTLASRRDWWAYQPVQNPPIPTVHNSGWSTQPLDQFVLARLEAKGLPPAEHAAPPELVRRLSFALTGLPPSYEMVSAFSADPNSAAWDALVDRLLASPHFGERWARHWMDVIRYTDTYGYEWDVPAKGSWRFRDYLVRAFNQDVGFDQLILEQLAGDLLEHPRLNEQDQVNESLIGPMFYQLGEKRHGDSSEFNGIHQEMLDNKIDAFSKAFQATTISCARCHDHKIDVVSQRDYYALAGVFMSSRWVTHTVDLPSRNASTIADLKSIKSRMRPLLAESWGRDSRLISSRMLAAVANPATANAITATPVTSAEKAPPLLPAGVSSTDPNKGAGNSVAQDPWQRLFAAREKELPPLEDPLHAWIKVLQAVRNGGTVNTAWNEVAASYQQEWTARRADNAAHFTPAVDFRNGIPDGWSVDGAGLREIIPCGEFTVSLAENTVVGSILPGGLFTNVISPRLNGAVRTPYFNQLSKFGHISFECCGGDFSTQRTVVDNAFLTEKQKYLESKSPSWVLMWTMSNMPERHIYLEFATKSSNPNFPPRVGLGGPCSEEQVAEPKSWFGITRAVYHNAPKTPADELRRFDGLVQTVAPDGTPAIASPNSLEEVAELYARWFGAAIDAWANGTADEDHVRLINWLLENDLLTNRLEIVPNDLAVLLRQYREAETRIKEPWTVHGVAEIDPPFEYRLNVRGDYDNLAEGVPQSYPEVLCRATSQFQGERGARLKLAGLIADRNNPLTARVFVNRVWHWLFGAGLVPTPDDFGRLGGVPSHPELLDWLSTQFVEHDWSVKWLVRTIITSQTWQQSTLAQAAALEADPNNRLLHHFSFRRLEAEEIRDQILAVSGRLDDAIGGPPINPQRANEDPQKRLFSGPIDGNGRRSLYIKITIMEPPKFLALFNQPAPKIPTGKRDVTNTPAQSLALLNDEFVMGQASYWGKRLADDPSPSIEAKIESMFRTALGRNPLPGEIDRWKSAFLDLSMLHGVSEQNAPASAIVWTDMAHAMFNLKEFIYIR